MCDSPTPISRPQAPPPSAGSDLFMSLISAALFLYVGFGLGLSGISGNVWYDGSVAAFTWGARIVGIGLLVAAALSYFRSPGAALIDFGLAALATVGCLVVGVIWLVFGDLQGVLLLLFGLLNGSAAKGAWQRVRTARASVGTSDDA